MTSKTFRKKALAQLRHLYSLREREQYARQGLARVIYTTDNGTLAISHSRRMEVGG